MHFAGHSKHCQCVDFVPKLLLTVLQQNTLEEKKHTTPLKQQGADPNVRTFLLCWLMPT